MTNHPFNPDNLDSKGYVSTGNIADDFFDRVRILPNQMDKVGNLLQRIVSKLEDNDAKHWMELFTKQRDTLKRCGETLKKLEKIEGKAALQERQKATNEYSKAIRQATGLMKEIRNILEEKNEELPASLLYPLFSNMDFLVEQFSGVVKTSTIASTR